ncbi:MAG: putative aminohydrolase SsnA [candidate division KSB1 bacterium]|nr:putative aminohydrolase SsnA [candidate division KSB1 bacterium]MDZ7367053.1 putative aminohydrolase SsnA [candidate division KSB1 bacterium]MDZ7406753.1 putative aminohydrolase SsnA [candidate division KSB1 bacterium]
MAAVESEADYNITKEQAWKKLKTYQGIRIVSPGKFYEILKKGQHKFSMSSILLKNATAVHIFPSSIHQIDLRIQSGRIVACGKDLIPEPGEQVDDLNGRLVLPGLVNAHTHLYSALARGMPGPQEGPKNFLEILQKIWWKLDRALDEESIYYSALIGAMEAVKAGTTTLVDHHASPNCISGSLKIVREALEQIGVRGVLCYEVTDRNGAAGREAGLRENQNFLDNHVNSQFRGLVGAHASFTLSDQALRACAGLAQQNNCGVHIHLAEDGCDAEISRRDFGRSDIVNRLADFGVLSEKTILAHGIFLSAADLKTILEHRCWLMHNARSNMNNSVGYAPVQNFGERVSLGTDGFPADMFEETRLAFFKGRDAKNGLGPADYLKFLSAGHQLCSELFGMPFGKLEPGAVADLIILDYSAPTPFTEENLAGHVLLGMKADHVAEVMIAGKFVLRNKTLIGVDVEKIYQKSRVAAAKLWKRLHML